MNTPERVVQKEKEAQHEKIQEIGFGGLRLLQDPEGFRYGIDAVLLADFASECFQGSGMAVDLGTGTGVIPFILSHKNPKLSIEGIDIQQRSVEDAERSCRINGLEERISFLCGDVSQIREHLPGESADLVTSNPPYVARGSGLINDSSSKFIARHETTADLDDFVKAAAWLLKDRGHFCMVHRPARLVDIFYSCRQHNLEPKQVRMVSPGKGQVPNIVLVDCVRNGGKELRFLPPLHVYEEDGSYSRQIQRIYERKPEDGNQRTLQR